MPTPGGRDYRIVGHTDYGEEIREPLFSDAQILREIKEVLAAAPDDKRSGIILSGDLKEKKVKAKIFGKLPIAGGKFVWTYAGTLAYDYENKDWTAKAHTAIWF
jgi:hypothetical protein